MNSSPSDAHQADDVHHRSEGEAPDESLDILPTVYADAADAADVADLAQAEQDVARGGGSAEQRDGVRRAGAVRRAEDRLERWRTRRR